MTFTMLSYDRRTDEYGACIRTSVPCVGALALQVSRRGAVCSQAYVNSDLALRVIEDLEDGTSAEKAVREALESDPQPDLRQVGALSAGTMFVHTGLDTLNWRGHVAGEDYVVLGNRMSGPGALEAISTKYQETAHLALPERLVQAMQAGDKAGGEQAQTSGFELDKTEGSAALVIASPTPRLEHNLRVDAHVDPLSDLSRLIGVAAQGGRVLDNFYPGTVKVVPFYWRRFE